MAAFPAPSHKSDTAESKAVIHAAIKAHVGAPVSCVPRVRAAVPSPISGRPKKSDARRTHPHSRHPEVPGIAVRPVSRRPQESVTGTKRLGINRQYRRRHGNRNKNASLGSETQGHRQNGARNHELRSHIISPTRIRVKTAPEGSILGTRRRNECRGIWLKINDPLFRRPCLHDLY